MAAEVVVVLVAAVEVPLGADLIRIGAGTTCGSGILRRSQDRTRPQRALDNAFPIEIVGKQSPWRTRAEIARKGEVLRALLKTFLLLLRLARV
jgi:hypothetical protein